MVISLHVKRLGEKGNKRRRVARSATSKKDKRGHRYRPGKGGDLIFSSHKKKNVHRKKKGKTSSSHQWKKEGGTPL